MNTASNVSAAKPRTTGAIFVAPVGTALPTTAGEELAPAFKDVGYVSEDGTSEDITKNTSKVKAWGGDTVLVTEDSYENTVKFKLIEILNIEALKFAFGSGNVSGTSLETGISVTKRKGNDDPVSVVIDTILSGGVLKRTVIPRGTLSGIGTIVQKANEAIGLDCTVECAADASGNLSYDYYKSGAPVAALSGLTIGTLALTPVFDPDTTEYEVETSNATNKVTAAAAEGTSVVIKLDGSVIENESSPTWEEGENVLTITASRTGAASTTYTVTVTKE